MGNRAHGKVYEIFAVIERNDFHIFGQYVLVYILYFSL